MTPMARELPHETPWAGPSPTAWPLPDIGVKPLRRPYWWEIRKVRVVAKGGGEVTRWNMSPALLVGLGALFISALALFAGWGWSLAVQLTVAQQDIIKLKSDFSDMKAYTSQVHDEQLRVKTEKDVIEKLNTKKGK